MKVTAPPPPKRGKKLPDMARRMNAIEATRAKFEGKEYRIGVNDCGQLARYHLKAMGHKKLPRPKPYSTEKGARKALRQIGHDSLETLMDSLLPRIAPASMLLGDVGLVAADKDDAAGEETLVISLGNKVWGWHPDQAELAVLTLEPGAIVAAWRA